MTFCLFAHLSQRLNGELTHAPAAVCRPSIIMVVHNAQTSSPKQLANQSQILCAASLGRGE